MTGAEGRISPRYRLLGGVLALCLASVQGLGSVQAVAAPPVPPPAEPAMAVPHGALADLVWTPLPEFGGAESVIYRSPDGKRVVAAFRESGDYTFEYPFDEFLIVTSGTGTFRVEGGPTLELKRGDYAYFRKGMKVHMTLSADFSDVTSLAGDAPVVWR